MQFDPKDPSRNSTEELVRKTIDSAIPVAEQLTRNLPSETLFALTLSTGHIVSVRERPGSHAVDIFCNVGFCALADDGAVRVLEFQQVVWPGDREAIAKLLQELHGEIQKLKAARPKLTVVGGEKAAAMGE